MPLGEIFPPLRAYSRVCVHRHVSPELLASSFFLPSRLAGGARATEPLSPKDVPEPLKPWTAWVTSGMDSALCPVFADHADTSRCAWPSHLELALDEHGGRFTQSWHMDAKGWVPLPGDTKRWPFGVNVGGARAVIVSEAAARRACCSTGGIIRSRGRSPGTRSPTLFTSRPRPGSSRSRCVGPASSPNRDAQGTVWLQKAATNEEGDALELVVHRKVTDDIPLVLTTRLELHVSGKSREELLGKALPPGFVPMSLQGDLPARLEPDGRVRVQVRPGVFALELGARSEGPVASLTRPAPDGVWREGEEVWVFEAKNDYRIVTVSGAPSIDPQQTTLPDAWKRLPAFAMKVGATLKLDEKRRGDSDPPANQLALTRTLWLDFEGGGFTASDTITGTLTRDSRLTMAAPTVLGRVAIGGKDQFITRLADPTRTGVEVRQGTLQVSADSRIPGDPSDIPAVGWAHDFHQVTGTLHLPPGWRLFYASGVDEVPGTWVRHWSLLELFLALVIAIGIGRLHGVRWGAIALVALALTFPEDGAPKWTWIAVLVAEAIFRALPAGRAKSLFSGVRAAAAVLVALIAIPFLVTHVREGLYPALERSGSVVTPEGRPQDATTLEEDGVASDNEFAEGDVVMPKSRAGALQLGGDERTRAPAGSERAPAPPAQAGTAAPSSNGKANALLRKGGSGAGSYAGSQGWNIENNPQVYDPAAIVQTGPGVPRWTWKTLALRWSGPVTATQRLHLYLLPPAANMVLALVRAALLVLLLVRLLPWANRLLPRGWGPAAAVAISLGLLFAPHVASATEIPSKELLDELQARLLRKPECLPSCASSGRMMVDARGRQLSVRLEVFAAAATAVPLPGATTQWSPSQVLLDGQPAKGLARLSDGTLWIELAAGLHQIVLEGPLPDGASMQLALPMKPHRVEATSAGWSIAGIHEDGLADDDLQLTRVEPQGGDAGGALQPGELPPFVRVERTLQIGLNWQVETRVARATPTGAAIVLEVPLLPGESVTTADVRVVGGKAQVNLGPQVSEVMWRSVLEQKSPVKLVAPRSLPWVEVWRADVGPVWHATYGGIPWVHTQPMNGLRKFPSGARGPARRPAWSSCAPTASPVRR